MRAVASTGDRRASVIVAMTVARSPRPLINWLVYRVVYDESKGDRIFVVVIVGR